MGTTPHEDLVGIYEIAEMAGKSRQAVANWRARLSNFPKPVAELKAGPVFDRCEVKAWLDLRNGQTASMERLITKTRDDETTNLRGAQMSQSNMSRHSKRLIIVGGGLAVIVAGVMVVGRFVPSRGASVMGTVVPAERYHVSQVSNGDVKLGDTGVAQIMQTDTFERMVKDPEFRKQVVNAANAANAADAARAVNAAEGAKAADAARAVNAAEGAKAADAARAVNAAEGAKAADAARAVNAAEGAKAANAADAAKAANAADAAKAAKAANAADAAKAANAADAAKAANAADAARAANAADAAKAANAADAAKAANAADAAKAANAADAARAVRAVNAIN